MVCGVGDRYVGVCWVCETYMRVGDGFVGDVGMSDVGVMWVSGECTH